MLDLFTIFSKGGIVLWYFQGTTQLFTNSVNELIKSVILQVRNCIIDKKKYENFTKFLMFPSRKEALRQHGIITLYHSNTNSTMNSSSYS